MDYLNKIIEGNCKELMRELPDESIDLIVTDPPYKKEYLYTYDYLAEESPRLLKQGASLIIIVGHYALPDIIKKFNNKLKYRWIFCMNQFEGSHARMAMGIEVMWKPILWYVKGAYPQGRGFIKDGFTVTGKSGQTKKYHKWEQDLSWANFFIEKLSKENDIILDPFVGSGTTCISAKSLNRQYIGFEINPEYIQIANKRIKTHDKN